MSPKLKQALSLFVSTTIILSQSSIPTYAVNTDSNLFEHLTQRTDSISTESDFTQNEESKSEVADDSSTTDEVIDKVDDETNNQGQITDDESNGQNQSTDDESNDQDQITNDNANNQGQPTDDEANNQDQSTDDESNNQGQITDDESNNQGQITDDESNSHDQSTDDEANNQDSIIDDDIIEQEQIINDENDDINEEDIMLFAAVDPKVVYTQATKSNLDTSGNGSRSNPYNRFEDAVANVEDGGTIIIKSGKNAFLNTQDEYGNIPFIINKNITIRSENDNTMADLVVRAGGIVLQGNVTFKNITFNFSNKYHDSIIANGYNLKIINCERGSGSREVDLFAGSLYDKNTATLTKGYIYDANSKPNLVTPKIGTNTSILLETTDTSVRSQFGKVFAGSMNGDFKGNVDITIKNGGNLDFVSVHSSGAEESDRGSMFDLAEPAPPQEKPNDYTVDGTVKIALTDYKTDIFGAGATESHVTIDTKYSMDDFKIEDVNSITVNSGTIVPSAITWKNNAGNLIISKLSSKLDLSNIKDLTVNDFTGGGILTLQKDGHLTINGNISGKTTFQTVGGAMDNSSSGLVVKDHVYITSKDNKGDINSFEFTPFSLQPGYKLERVEENRTSKWIAKADSNLPTLPDSLSTLEFTTKEETLLIDNSNPNGTKISAAVLEYTLTPELIDDPFLIYDLPFELFISGKKAAKHDNNGYPYWSSKEFGLKAELSAGPDDECFIDFLPNIDTSGTLPSSFKPGTYEVILALPDYGLNASATLHVVEESSTSGPALGNSETQMTLQVDNQTVDTQTPVLFGKELTINANIQQKANSPLPFALRNEVDFIVNGKIIKTVPVINNTASLNIDITTDNGFITGENEIKLLFGGSDALNGSTISQKLTVKKIKPQITLSSDIRTVYDGKQHPLTATVGNLKNVTPTISYYTNNEYTEGKTNLPPVNVGTYYAEVSLPEGDIYEGITLKQGTVTLTKATPEIVLSSTIINNSDATTDLKVYATMKFPESGSIPVGEIKFECIDENGNKKDLATEKLSYGTTSHVFKNLSDGTYTITASYIPRIDGIEDRNYTEVNNIQESFEVRNGFVSVEDVDLISSELQLSTSSTGMVLPFTITPDNATNRAVVWESNNPNIVTVDPVTGKLDIKSEGTVLITIRTKDGNYSNSSQITIVENTNNNIPVQSISLDQTSVVLDLNGTNTQSLIPTIAPTTATNQNIIWKSEDDSIATVDDNGKIVAKSVGRTKIMAITQDGAQVAICNVQVRNSQQATVKVTGITLQENHLILEKGQRKMLIPTITPSNASDQGLSWTSSNTDIVEVTEKGTLIAKSVGVATITATTLDGSGVTATSTVTVSDGITPPSGITVTRITLDQPKLSLLKGNSATLKATLLPLNATNKNVAWKSDNETVATVTSDGVVTAKSAGTATITATALGGNNITATSTVTVTESTTPSEKVPVTGIKLDKQKITLRQGQKDSLVATVLPYNATNKEVTWSSANPSIVSVDSHGNITAHAQGRTTITATTKDGGFTASCDITVTSSPSGSGNTGSSGDSSNSNNSSTNKEENTPVTPKPEAPTAPVAPKPEVPTPETTTNRPAPTVTVSQFQDITDNWAKNDIQFVIEKGLFQGLTETTFGVNSPMTRAMVVTVLHRLADTPQVGTVTFSDVKAEAFYSDAVSWANTLGIVSGVGQSEFAPNQNVTREQLAVMLYQYAKVLGLATEDALTHESQFKDTNQISNWSKNAIQWAVDEGILLGNPDGTLNPKGVATRAQVATITRRFVELTEKTHL